MIVIFPWLFLKQKVNNWGIGIVVIFPTLSAYQKTLGRQECSDLPKAFLVIDPCRPLGTWDYNDLPKVFLTNTSLKSTFCFNIKVFRSAVAVSKGKGIQVDLRILKSTSDKGHNHRCLQNNSSELPKPFLAYRNTFWEGGCIMIFPGLFLSSNPYIGRQDCSDLPKAFP